MRAGGPPWVEEAGLDMLVEQIGTPGDQTESADHKSGNWLQSYVGDLAEWGRS